MTGVVKVKRLCCNHILGKLRNFKSSCFMAHRLEASKIFFLSCFQSAANTCSKPYVQSAAKFFKSEIKAFPSRDLLVQCQPAVETPEQCVKYVQINNKDANMKSLRSF